MELNEAKLIIVGVGKVGKSELVQAREKPLHATIQKALTRLEEATYQGYFEEMDKLALPAYLKGLYNQLKLQFISSPTSWTFNQQLETFAREANKYL